MMMEDIWIYTPYNIFNLFRLFGEINMSLMLFILDNLKDLLTKAYIHDLDTRNKNHLHFPIVSLSCIQKGVS
jgi:hypothetical protein